ncbi:A-kinase anchor protein 17B isoform X2 [Pelodiscus sinensis]|nr:A-kinase anchor protein 17B isoform X2 [Pelodiscus sinensis]|eukprot:XP_025036665.1 A-kinase anchor protein 17B isoform X2 [Pelodiscus sinensis]
MTITVVYDNSEAMELCASQKLYLKPVAKLTINVMFPEHTEATQSFSKWEVMDKLKNMICPDQFTTVRVSKSTKDFIRFEGEAETKRLILTLKEKLHGKVTFDKTKHFSKGAVKKRRLESQKLQELEQERKREKEREEEEAARKRRDDEKNARERKRKAKLKRKEHRQIDRDEKRPRKQQKVTTDEEQWPENMPEWEERKYLLAQRRVESIRLLTVLLNRVKEFAQFSNQNVEPLLYPEDVRKDCFPEPELRNAQTDQRESHYLLHTQLKNKKKIRSQFFQTGITCFNAEEVPTNLPASPCHLVKTVLNDPIATASTGKLTGRDEYGSSGCGSLQITVTQDSKVIQSLEREDCPPLNTVHSGKVSSTGYCRKQKIYETDEFIHYLLNYYQTPRYARVCLKPKSSISKSWWQRIVSDNGSGFQINLKNTYGQHLTEVSFSQSPDKGNCSGDDNFSWEITIRNSETTENASKNKAYAGEFTKKFQVQWNDSLDIATLPYAEFSNSFGGTNTCHDTESKQDNNISEVVPPYKSSGAAYKLKDLLEEISSDSEYFSEALNSSAKRTERKYKGIYCEGNKACSLPREMGKKFLVCVKNVPQNDPENESKKHSFCSNSTHSGLTKRYRHKLKKSHKRCNSKLRHEGRKSEWKSNEEARNTHKKKKKRKKPSPNILHDEHSFSETDSWRQLESLKKIQRKCSKMFHHKMKFRTLNVMAAASKDAIPANVSLLQGSHQRAGEVEEVK